MIPFSWLFGFEFGEDAIYLRAERVRPRFVAMGAFDNRVIGAESPSVVAIAHSDIASRAAACRLRASFSRCQCAAQFSTSTLDPNSFRVQTAFTGALHAGHATVSDKLRSAVKFWL